MTRTYSQMQRSDKYSETQLNHLTSWTKWLSVCLRTKSLWVRVLLDSHKRSNFAPVLNKEYLDIKAPIECGFAVKHIRCIIKT